MHAYSTARRFENRRNRFYEKNGQCRFLRAAASTVDCKGKPRAEESSRVLWYPPATGADRLWLVSGWPPAAVIFCTRKGADGGGGLEGGRRLGLKGAGCEGKVQTNRQGRQPCKLDGLEARSHDITIYCCVQPNH